MPKEFPGIRFGRPEDLDAIYDFLLMLDIENSVFDLSENKARESISTCLDPKRGVVGIIDRGNGIEACVGLRASQMWYSEEWFFDELWNYVHPDYRKVRVADVGHAERLIEFSKWASLNLGIPLVMGIVTKNKLAAKVRLYQRHMPQIGAYFVWGKKFDDVFQQRRSITKSVRDTTLQNFC
jgi:hypothetical protein